MLHSITVVLGKPVEWVVLVVVMFGYLIMRTPSLPWMQRLASGFLSAGLAFAGSSDLAPVVWDNELAAAILIMLVGPFVMGSVLVLLEDKEFAKETLQMWVRKKLNLEGGDNAKGD